MVTSSDPQSWVWLAKPFWLRYKQLGGPFGRLGRPAGQAELTDDEPRQGFEHGILHDWRRFVIAEAGGAPIGVAQLRRHPDGSRELASLVVLSEHRGRGVVARMIDALLTDEPGPVFTLVDRRYAQHFTRWDFHPVARADLPGR